MNAFQTVLLDTGTRDRIQIKATVSHSSSNKSRKEELSLAWFELKRSVITALLFIFARLNIGEKCVNAIL